MKKIIIISCLLIIASQTMAQFNNTYHSNKDRDDDGYGFNRKSMFAGGTIGLGFAGNDFNVGASPEIGFTVQSWLDVGALVNINYFSERADPNYIYNQDTRTRSFNYGVGAFARVYPIKFLFVQVEPEFNFIATSYKDFGSTPTSTYSYQTQAPSLLMGVGYSQRIIGQSNFYLALMYDVLNNPNSPYRDAYTNTPLPVFKAGFDIYLHPRG